jgi:hypothetical protein
MRSAISLTISCSLTLCPAEACAPRPVCSTAARDEPAGVRRAVAQDAVITQCGIPLRTLRLWDVIWP